MIKGERQYKVSLPTRHKGKRGAKRSAPHVRTGGKKKLKLALGTGNGSQEGENGQFPRMINMAR